MNINLQITHKETREVKIPVPSFWKDDRSQCLCYRAVLDDKTFINLFSVDDRRVSVSNAIPKDNVDLISEAHTEWTPVDESEFMRVYDDAWESMRMKPRLIEVGEEKQEAIRESVTL